MMTSVHRPYCYNDVRTTINRTSRQGVAQAAAWQQQQQQQAGVWLIAGVSCFWFVACFHAKLDGWMYVPVF